MPSVAMLEPESEKGSFGARLRAERERRKISIATIAHNTKILGALLEGLENDDVSRWPLTGFYRRAFIRAYAVAVGLDPEPVVREFFERFPVAEDVASAADTDSAPVTPDPVQPLRLTLADTAPFFAGGPVLRTFPTRLRAIALDAFVLAVIGLSLFVVLGSFWAPLCVAALVYYIGSILILGNTPGVCLFATRSTGKAAAGSRNDKQASTG
jgi:hypothetical protein